MFKERVLTIWMIIYDHDASRVYTTNSFEKMLASIESSIRGYYGDDTPAFEHVYGQVITRIRAAENQPCIPMKFDNLTINVYRWEIDESNAIHQVLEKCHEEVGPELREEIEALFSTSVFT